MTYQIFLSYSRLDNEAKGPNGKGWVDNFCDTLKRVYYEMTNKELSIFYDVEAIDNHRDWKTTLLQGIRSSQIFLAFMSPNYLKSENCRWEWKEYLRFAHYVSRGHDGLFKVFFTTVPGFQDSNYDVALDPDSILSIPEVKAFIEEQQEEFKRKQLYLDKDEEHPDANAVFDLRSWSKYGPEYLLEQDLKKRISEFETGSLTDNDVLIAKMIGINKSIMERLDHCLLATFTEGNVGRPDKNFVGRYKELIAMHTYLSADKIGTICSVNGLGGLGKTSLAIQYAHAYAEFYVAGGTWLIDCAGKTKLYDALQSYFLNNELRLNKTEMLKIDINKDHNDTEGLKHILEQLKTYCNKRAEYVKEQFSESREKLGNNLIEITPRILLILDNLNDSNILSSTEINEIKNAPWLEILVTSRLGKEEFGHDLQNVINIDFLNAEDSYNIFRCYQQDNAIFKPEYEKGIFELVKVLNGYPLAVSLVAAHLGKHASVNPSDLAITLAKGIEKLQSIEIEPGIKNKITIVNQSQWTIEAIIEFTYKAIDTVPYAGQALKYASFMHNENISKANIEELLAKEYPESTIQKQGEPNPMAEVWEKLISLQILKEKDTDYYTMHAVISDAVRAVLIDEEEKKMLLEQMYSRYKNIGLANANSANEGLNVSCQLKYYIEAELITPYEYRYWVILLISLKNFNLIYECNNGIKSLYSYQKNKLQSYNVETDLDNIETDKFLEIMIYFRDMMCTEAQLLSTENLKEEYEKAKEHYVLRLNEYDTLSSIYKEKLMSRIADIENPYSTILAGKIMNYGQSLYYDYFNLKILYSQLEINMSHFDKAKVILEKLIEEISPIMNTDGAKIFMRDLIDIHNDATMLYNICEQMSNPNAQLKTKDINEQLARIEGFKKINSNNISIGNKYYDAADEYFSQYDYENAITLFNLAIEYYSKPTEIVDIEIIKYKLLTTEIKLFVSNANIDNVKLDDYGRLFTNIPNKVESLKSDSLKHQYIEQFSGWPVSFCFGFCVKHTKDISEQSKEEVSDFFSSISNYARWVDGYFAKGVTDRYYQLEFYTNYYSTLSVWDIEKPLNALEKYFFNIPSEYIQPENLNPNELIIVMKTLLAIVNMIGRTNDIYEIEPRLQAFATYIDFVELKDDTLKRNMGGIYSLIKRNFDDYVKHYNVLNRQATDDLLYVAKAWENIRNERSQSEQPNSNQPPSNNPEPPKKGFWNKLFKN